MKKLLALLLIAVLCIGSATTFLVSAQEDDTKVDKYVESAGNPIVDQVTPKGSGNRFIAAIKDGVIGSGEGDYGRQYDTYLKDAAVHDSFFGYDFEQEFDVTGIDFYEGIHFGNGGWFANGTLHVEAKIGEEWKKVTLTNTPNYPVGNEKKDFGASFEKYEFRFEPVTCTGIRIIGEAGGAQNFTSCSELRVLARMDADEKVPLNTEDRERLAAAQTRYEQNRMLEGFATPITNGAPTGTSGGSQNIRVINDGVTAPSDNKNNRLQFDSYSVATKLDTLEYVGYTFDAPYEVEKLIYQIGKIWESGGWFAYGFEVEVLRFGEWESVEVIGITPEYKESNVYTEFSDWQTYEITIDPVICEGIRLIGLAGGNKLFISCTELSVIGNMNPDLTGYVKGEDKPNVTPGDDDDGSDTPGDNQNGNGQNNSGTTKDTEAVTTGATEEKKKGCGSAVVPAQAWILTAVTAVVAGSCIGIKRKKERETR